MRGARSLVVGAVALLGALSVLGWVVCAAAAGPGDPDASVPPPPAAAQRRTCPSGLRRLAGAVDGTIPVYAVACVKPGGTAQGPVRLWNADGRVAVAGRFVNGEPAGHWRGYDHGILVRLERFDRGHLDGPQDVRAPGFAIHRTIRYGRVDGPYTLDIPPDHGGWFGPMRDGRREGVWTIRSPQGDWEMRGRFHHDLPVGVFTLRGKGGGTTGTYTFDAKGRLVEHTGPDLETKRVLVPARRLERGEHLTRENTTTRRIEARLWVGGATLAPEAIGTKLTQPPLLVMVPPGTVLLEGDVTPSPSVVRAEAAIARLLGRKPAAPADAKGGRQEK